MLSNNKLKVIASSLALSVLLNGCSLSINKKDKNNEFKNSYTSQLNNNMSLEDALAFLESSECLSLFYADGLTCPIEKTDKECYYQCKDGYYPYFVENNAQKVGMMGIDTKDGYSVFNVGYHYEDGNAVPNNLDGAIGLRKDFLYLIEITTTIQSLIKERNSNVTTELKQIASNYYLLPKNYQLYCLNDNTVAYLAKETEDGLVYIINDADVNNFVAVKNNMMQVLNHGQILIDIVTNAYYTPDKNYSL